MKWYTNIVSDIIYHIHVHLEYPYMLKCTYLSDSCKCHEISITLSLGISYRNLECQT